MDIWTKMVEGNGWCEEISTLQANGNPPPPGRHECFNINLATVTKDDENDIMYWQQTLRDGTVLQVFND